ncbi:hypothetical protein D6853_01990 [Butyrivibrio sp. X503]|uniref:hypothetical protein n=1 Tax=Butyrivibrio sp. X503 TaxID=2364878 RepID=UPI000EA901EA|nr:hypothetical protein [Butyrivibrio sp. X503]RKM58326.1 hypothetical protein D6853_01990 [Butyrivibrio sp. X503]
MLHLSYVGIAFAAVFYVVFGIAVRLMELSNKGRNKARLWIVVITLCSLIVSNLGAGVLNLMMGRVLWSTVFLILGFFFAAILGHIFMKLHNIKVRIKMRKFMVLFDIVDHYMNEGKTKEEILDYLTKSQKLARKDAINFLNFISDPTNYQFLSDVNDKIREARMLSELK